MTEEQEDSVGAIVESAENKLEKAARDLNVVFPKGQTAFPLRIITFIMLIGGLSILGSSFTDFVVPNREGFMLYLFRLCTGVAFLGVSYGIYTRERWAVWLYGFVVFFGLVINFSIAFVPALLVYYLYTERKSFKPCICDKYSIIFIKKARLKLKSLFRGPSTV